MRNCERRRMFFAAGGALWRELLLSIGVAFALAGLACFGVTHFPSEAYEIVAFILKLVPAFFIAMPVSTVVHEAGHALMGLVFGVPISGLRVGGGLRVTIPVGRNFRLVLGLSCYTGQVEFPWLPVSRNHRIAMYLAGVLATIPVAIVLCLFPLRGQVAYQIGMLLLVTASAIDNLRGRHPDETRNADRWSDGDAVRGLMSY